MNMKHLLALICFLFLFTPGSIFAEKIDFRFKTVYHKPFYKNPYIVNGVIAGTAVVAATVTVYTAGAGAPAAATGVSTVATWIGGGSSGAYMAGLSTVGSAVGGNALTGAAILNSISAMTVGGIAGKATTATAAAIALRVLEAGQIGVTFYSDESRNADYLAYSIDIPLVKIGDETAAKLIEHISRFNKEIQSGVYSRELIESERLVLKGKSIALKNSSNLENRVVGIIALYNLGFIDEFKEYSYNIPHSQKEENNSIVLYLKSIAYLLDGNWSKSASCSYDIMVREPKVIEPVMLYTIAKFNEDELSSKVEEIIGHIQNFSKNYYTTVNNKLAAYVLFGDLCSYKKLYDPSARLYKLAYDETDWLGESDVKAKIAVKYANSLYKTGQHAEAKKFYAKAIEKSSDENIEVIKSSCDPITACM